MIGRGLVVVTALPALLLLAGCTRPEAARMRGGGPGADPNNRARVVRMHEGSQPYRGTPRLIEPYGDRQLASALQAHQLSLRERFPGRR